MPAPDEMSSVMRESGNNVALPDPALRSQETRKVFAATALCFVAFVTVHLRGRYLSDEVGGAVYE